MVGDLIIEIYVSECHLSPPASGQLVEFKYQLLRKLLMLFICPSDKIWGKVHIYRVPSYRPCKMVLQYRCHLKYVGKKDVGMLRRVGNACYRRNIETVTGNIRNALP
ncbi:hypothetical protein SDC9_184909 [bioreactor metagenome]|uniref:Uncharacterized protein n=1 Tax=bioreactor metagenome TaxID=1076179 RepID=A0A645HG79_9ZZZZ